jgi:hypothetical protein
MVRASHLLQAGRLRSSQIIVAFCRTHDTIAYRSYTGREGEKVFMDWNWQEFEQGPEEKKGKGIYVTINARGHFFLNGKALEALGEPDAVVMMYEPRRSTIGIKRAPIDRNNSYRLYAKDRGRASGKMLYASNFCRFHHIRPGETLRFTAAEVNKDGILVLSMHDVHSVKKIR